MKPTKKTMKKVKAFVVICSLDGDVRAFSNRGKAQKHRKFLDDEYRPDCTHQVVPCTITYKVITNKAKSK